MKILKIQRNKLFLDNEEIIDTNQTIIRHFDLEVEKDISSDYDDICYESVFSKALFVLSLRDRTEKELLLKLSEKYQNEKMIVKAVEKIKELKYINDRDYAKSYLESSKYGKKRAVFNLMNKGVSKQKSEEAYDEIIEDNPLFETNKLKTTMKKCNKKEEGKQIEYLMRQGFDYDIIKKELKKS